MKTKDSQQYTAYHSSKNEFDEFDFSKLNTGTGDGNMWGNGFYFCESPTFAKEWNDHGYLYKCRLTFKNPYVCETQDDRDELSDLINAQLDEDGMNTQDMTEFFDLGYDSVVSLNEEWNDPDDEDDIEYHNQYVAFKKGQIKILSVSKY